jgi:hypothetical protein
LDARKCAEFRSGWVHTRALVDEALVLVTEGFFDPTPLLGPTHSFAEAPEALVEDFVKLVFSREAES